MSRKKQKETPDVAPTDEATALAELRAEEDHTDAQWDALSALGVPREWCIPVPCNLPGYERLTVWFRVNNRYDVARKFKGITENMPMVDVYKVYSLFMIRFDGWDFRDELTGEPIPAPSPSDPESYEVLQIRYYDLQMWCRYAGYIRALELLFDLSTGPN